MVTVNTVGFFRINYACGSGEAEWRFPRLSFSLPLGQGFRVSCISTVGDADPDDLD